MIIRATQIMNVQITAKDAASGLIAEIQKKMRYLDGEEYSVNPAGILLAARRGGGTSAVRVATARDRLATEAIAVLRRVRDGELDSAVADDA